MVLTCKAQALDALNEIEDTLGTLRFVAQRIEEDQDQDLACLAREANRLLGMRLEQVDDLREYIDS